MDVFHKKRVFYYLCKSGLNTPSLHSEFFPNASRRP